jgi:hypothetical protein
MPNLSMKLRISAAVDLTWPHTNLKDKQVHLVCPAIKSLTAYGALSTIFMSEEESLAHAMRVNKANETGTLYPKCPITIIPLSIFEERNDFGNHEIMERHIEDCFVANERYWRIPHLDFCFDQEHVFDCELALSTLNQCLEKRDFEFTRSISAEIVR